MKLEGKTVVVTGASAGLGKSISELFVQEGANVVAVARRQTLLDELAASLKDAAGKIVTFVGDVSKKGDNEAMIDLAVTKFGRLDVLINNAGIMDDVSAIGDVTDEMLEKLINVNTFGPLYAMRKAVQVFLKQDDGGNIINIVSVGAFCNIAGVAYNLSKAAMVSATKHTAFMYLENEIRCNAIAPGGIMTDISQVMPTSNEFGKARVDTVIDLMPKLGEPEDIAATALFLASDESKFINGVILTVDGGWTNL